MNSTRFLLLFGLLVFACAPEATASAENATDAKRAKPNIVLINLDDADYRMFSPDLLKLYPNIERLADQSLSFTNAHVTTPFCGPSRASLFRGQYAHRTGVRVNIPESNLSLGFKGGYSEFLRLGHDQNELGVWMKAAGYRTMMIGKYHHNGFDFKIPPGWDDFYMSNGGRYQGTYRFTNQHDPAGSNSKNGDDNYRTDQEADDAVRLIRNHAGVSSRRTEGSSNAGHTPFFLYLAPLAPHRPVGSDFTLMVDKTKYAKWQPELRIPRTPEFDEDQMSDKPLPRQSPPYSEEELASLESEYLSRARAVKSVDDMVGRVLDVLMECKITDSTFVFFTSDNGYQLGQHRLHNKLDPYQMCTNVPLYVSGPGIKPNQFANHLLAHIDLCPTILELAGAEAPNFLDGKSFVSLLTDPRSVSEPNWRESIVIENWQAKRNRGDVLPGTYSGLRYFDQLYVEWASGDKEYYDLANDPFELENKFSKLDAITKSKLKNDLMVSRHVEMDPLVTIIPAPVETTQTENSNWIRGYAEDDQRIEAVHLTISKVGQEIFWNGTTWTDEPAELSANISATDQQLVTWNFEMSRELENETGLAVTARATDGAGNISEKTSEVITPKK